MKTWKILLLLSLLLTLLPAGPAARAAGQSEIVTTITKPAYLKTGVLVNLLDVLSGGAAAVQDADLLETVIRQDLEYSGFFLVGSSEDRSDSLGYQYIIEGSVEGPLRDAELTGEEAPTTVNLNFLDYGGRSVIFSKRYRSLPGKMRATAHHFSALVIEFISSAPANSASRIVFCRGERGRTDLYVIDYDGFGEKRVTANRTLNICPSWSPDSREIAFTSYRNGLQGLFSLDTSSGLVRPIIEDDGLNFGADWHPDGHELLLSMSREGNPEIYRISPEGRIIKRLTVARSIEVSPSWAPNGRELVFTSDRTGTPQLYIIDDEGTGRRRRTFESQYNDSADWSPDGRRIVYTTRDAGRNMVVVMDASGENRRVLTDRSWGNCEDPSWAPDGRHIVFTSDRTGVYKLFVYDVDEGTSRQLTFGGDPDTTPDWSN